LASESVAVFVPMDGYHLTRAQLSAMPDPETAHFRRGAAFTFDAEAFVALVRRVREPLTSETRPILAPSFDHAVKDPIDDDITIPPSARIVVFEGNYLSLNKDNWKSIRDLVDESWFVEVEEETARERVAQRHFKAGITDSVESGRERADKLDLINGREIVKHRGRVDEVIVSREDKSWTPEAQMAHT
jgi:pantothenate kinase